MSVVVVVVAIVVVVLWIDNERLRERQRMVMAARVEALRLHQRRRVRVALEVFGTRALLPALPVSRRGRRTRPAPGEDRRNAMQEAAAARLGSGRLSVKRPVLAAYWPALVLGLLVLLVGEQAMDEERRLIGRSAVDLRLVELRGLRRTRAQYHQLPAARAHRIARNARALALDVAVLIGSSAGIGNTSTVRT